MKNLKLEFAKDCTWEIGFWTEKDEGRPLEVKDVKLANKKAKEFLNNHLDYVVDVIKKRMQRLVKKGYMPEDGDDFGFEISVERELCVSVKIDYVYPQFDKECKVVFLGVMIKEVMM